MAEESGTVAFLDTNTFLHYPSLDQIDWHKVLGSKTVALIVTPVVIRELNKHKDTPRTAKIRERASAALRKLDGWSEQGLSLELRDRVHLVFRPKDPLIDFHSNGLSNLISDDHLLASIIEHQREHKDKKHVMITDDLGLKLKARSCGIAAVQIPAKLRLPDETLESERKIAHLEKKSADLQHLVPKPKLAFADGGKTFKIRMQGATAENESLAEKLTAIKLKYPKRTPPQARSP